MEESLENLTSRDNRARVVCRYPTERPVTIVVYYPDFHKHGETPCSSYNPEAFFPDPEIPGSVDAIEEAVKVCKVCPYQHDCLLYALEANEEWGIWGGSTKEERKRIRRRASRRGVPVSVVIGPRPDNAYSN